MGLYGRVGLRRAEVKYSVLDTVKGKMSPDIQGGIADRGWLGGSGKLERCYMVSILRAGGGEAGWPTGSPCFPLYHSIKSMPQPN